MSLLPFLSGFRQAFPAVVMPRQVLSGRFESARPRAARDRASGEERLYIGDRELCRSDGRTAGGGFNGSFYFKTTAILAVRRLVFRGAGARTATQVIPAL